ncbi:MAG: YqgE/AlgH family protein [Flavobacteriaceae bacterium]
MTTRLHQGDLIVADPSIIGDVSFHRSVIVIAAIHDSNPMGFVINKPFEFSLPDVVPEVRKDFPIFYGGPVDPDELFFIHTHQNIFERSTPICDDFFLGGEINTAIENIHKGVLTPQNCRFFLGYSGWSKGQLEQEIKQKHWLIQKKAPTRQLFKFSVNSLWRDALNAQGGHYRLWANSPENPSHN